MTMRAEDRQVADKRVQLAGKAALRRITGEEAIRMKEQRLRHRPWFRFLNVVGVRILPAEHRDRTPFYRVIG